MIQGARRKAVAGAQLLDPKWAGGTKQGVTAPREVSGTRRDNFTEFTIGLSQEFPRAAKRKLQGARKQLDADVDRAALDNERRMVRRDASLAWLDVYEAEQGLELSRRLGDEGALEWPSLQTR